MLSKLSPIWGFKVAQELKVQYKYPRYARGNYGGETDAGQIEILWV